jgi:hypothetical protein
MPIIATTRLISDFSCDLRDTFFRTTLPDDSEGHGGGTPASLFLQRRTRAKQRHDVKRIQALALMRILDAAPGWTMLPLRD